MTDREKALELALRNCLALARRQWDKDTDDVKEWAHIIRFCRNAGIEVQILRTKQ